MDNDQVEQRPLKRPRGDSGVQAEEKKEASLKDRVDSLKVTVIDLKTSKPQDPAIYFVARFLPVIELDNVSWPVPPPESGIRLDSDGTGFFYTDQVTKTRDAKGDLRVRFYARAHGSNTVLRHGKLLLFVPYLNTYTQGLAYGNSKVKYDAGTIDPLLNVYKLFGAPGCTITVVQQLGEAMAAYHSMQESVRTKLYGEAQSWGTGEDVDFARIKSATNDDHRPMKLLAQAFLSHHLSNLSLGEFLEGAFQELPLEASVGLLATLNLGYPLRKLGGNIVDKHNVKQQPIKLSEAGADDEVVTSTTALTLQTLKELKSDMPVYVLPAQGLYRSVPQKGKSSQPKLIPLECSSTRANHLNIVLAKIKAEAPKVASSQPASSDEAAAGDESFIDISF